MYVCEAIPIKGKLPINLDCDFCENSGGNKEIEKYNEGKSKSYVSDKICRFAYNLNLIHKFDKGNSLKELKNYKHSESGKPWKPPQAFVYIGSYPRLIEDIIAGKIW